MKASIRIALLAGLLYSGPAFAQSGVPSEMSYQAIVTDNDNALIAPTAAADYEVIVRIYGAATGGNPLWSEKFVTSIFQGRLSITLGGGEPVALSGSENEPNDPLETVFTDLERFIELTVRDLGGGGDPITLAPRQKIVATATALRSKLAERADVADTALSADVARSVAAGGLTRDAITAGSLDGTIFNNGAVNSLKIGTGLVSNTEFSYLNGASGNIQAQLTSQGLRLDAKADKSNPSFTGDLTLTDGDDPTIKLQSDGTSVVSGRLSMRQSNEVGYDIYYDGRNSAGAYDALVFEAFSTGGAAVSSRPVPDMVIDHGDGNVGFGVVEPEAALHVVKPDPTIKLQSAASTSGKSTLSMRQGNGTGVDVYYNGNSGQDKVIFEMFGGGTSVGNAMVFKDYGERSGDVNPGGINVGIGTDNPEKARLVVVNGTDTESNRALLGGDARNIRREGVNDILEAGTRHALSIHADQYIAALGLAAFSDARIKSIDGQSDARSDLATLNKIEVTDYHFIDHVRNGAKPQKKVIAQQVEEFFPQAVSRSTEVVPDIYKKARLKNGWVSLDTTLAVGEKVKLMTLEEEGLYEVLELGEGKFRTALDRNDEVDVFVFGREVDDFRSVDYDAIAMLHVSATQELSRRLEAKEQEVETLTARLAAMEARMLALENRDSQDSLPVTAVSK